ncbi:AcrR family transcriptional regulator [Kibdelosporangium banguiense]|uniref:AcrR family transcriptional regulator n=1 Tax=Kibdelosporangium banguiense TaxID=1365924 RepID=A0ABS4TR15_9PSEU|nr:TetR/AcrR family transcriptional regulator [Kibdelosporangium banguiense]MBP2326854.1 AcrR family transcriptional regulator [Kibdelosporangium banguiense]
MSNSEAVRRRRRGTELEQALLDAAWDELQDVGYAAFTVDAVAQRAATSRPVLYRRWPNRAQLVLAAVRSHLPTITPDDIPDTGNLRNDLIAALQLWRHRYEQIGPTIMNGLASELDHLSAENLDVIPAFTTVIVERAAHRGEIGPHPVPAHVRDVPSALLRHELVVQHHRPTDEQLTRIVDDIALPAIERAAGNPEPTRGRRPDTTGV